MKKASKNRPVSSSAPEIQVFVRFNVTITEIHSRTSTICDEQSGVGEYEFGSNFEMAKRWLESDHSWSKLGVFATDACIRWDKTLGEKR